MSIINVAVHIVSEYSDHYNYLIKCVSVGDAVQRIIQAFEEPPENYKDVYVTSDRDINFDNAVRDALYEAKYSS